MDKEKEEIIDFDDNFPDGVFATSGEVRVKIRSLYNYCKERGGISPQDLTSEEMEKFIEKK